MQWLNYHHLYYFWSVAHEGSVTAAAAKLQLSRPTVTGQLRRLERSFGNKLFRQSGRRLLLTAFGETVLAYADDIFATGQELQRAVSGAQGDAHRLIVGVPDEMPKLIVFRLLQPAFNLPTPPRIICREGKRDELLADLAIHRLDLVLSDAPLDSSSSVKAYNHKLGECGVTFFACPEHAKKLKAGFPRSLHNQSMFLPTASTTTRRLIDRWLEAQGIYPLIAGEFEDSALMKVFGQAGGGAFPAPTVIEQEVIKQYAVHPIGQADGVVEKYFAISVERRLKHPAVIAITASAREGLFGMR